MPKKILLAASILVASILSTPIASYALDDQQKQEIGSFIREYLVENPEIMLEVQDALTKKQQAAQSKQAEVKIAENTQAIFNSKFDAVLGNPDGDVTIVEFYDYNCGYCKRALSDMDALLSEDKKLRFVLKELPILGPESMEAHKVAAAFKSLAPAKYPEFHRALLGGEGRADEATAVELAGRLGVKEAALRAVMERQDDASVREAYKLATDLGITGTPAYVIGTETISGAVGAAALQQKIANVRACGKATC
ncbi:DsbA family protein [Rhizobium sp. CFBP 8762]|uniref:DsbA family protein n=1 Tax=Rhizobium sp. CFBP 8762 TaxID=2775279 RepID=UPI00313DD8F4